MNQAGRSADEKVYPKTRITLNQMHVYTDEKGMFEFPVLDPGDYHLDMDMSQLPSGIIPAIRLPPVTHPINFVTKRERNSGSLY